jgi:hypothetical protein
MFVIDRVRGNYTGHRTHVKSLCIELKVLQSLNTNTQVYLNQDISATQLNGKIITQIICNTLESQPIDGSIGNMVNPIKYPNNLLINTFGLALFGYTLTLVNKKGDVLLYDYPLTNLITTGQNSGVILTNKPPRVYKFFNCEISADESYISTFDPTAVITRTNIISLEFFYIDKK